MLFASIGILGLSLTIALSAMIVTFPWLIILVQRQQNHKIPRVAVPAFAVIIVAMLGFWWSLQPEPREFAPLIHDVAIIIDNSQSMAIADDYREAATREQLAALTNTPKPSRLQIAQALLTRAEPSWFKTLLQDRQARVHLYHFDERGRLVKLRDANGDAGTLADPEHESGMRRAANAISKLEPLAKRSPLGSAIRDVIGAHHDGPLTHIILMTDGVTTEEDTIRKAAAFAADKNVALLLVGLGETPRDVLVHDLVVDPSVPKDQPTALEARLSGIGFGDREITIALKLKDADGGEALLRRTTVKLDPNGEIVTAKFVDLPRVAGLREYVVEAEPPPLELGDKPIRPANLRLERTIDVTERQAIKVLFVEGQPRYEFRYITSLIDGLGEGQRFKLDVLLLDADDEWRQPQLIQENENVKLRPNFKPEPDPLPPPLREFPKDLAALNQYDVLLFGDCDLRHAKLKDHLHNIARFVRGDDDKGNPTQKGGGILFIAGASDNPHKYKGTPLANVMPVEPTTEHLREIPRTEAFRPILTPAGRAHPIFRFRPDERENAKIWESLQPLFWHSDSYRPAPHAEALAVHPSAKGVVRLQNGDERHPLILEMPVGSGRSMFFGIDETWRWRRGEEKAKFAQFWVQVIQHLARRPNPLTTLSVDSRVPYRQGDTITLSVRFATEIRPLLAKSPAIAMATFLPLGGKNPEFIAIPLKIAAGQRDTFQGTIKNAQPGHYRIRLTEPDLVVLKLGKTTPMTLTQVDPLPREDERVPLNVKDLKIAAEVTRGAYFSATDADRLLNRSLAPR